LRNELQPLFDLTGKTALVTGASSGFGWHFSRVLAGAGAKVLAGARRTDRLEELCREIGANGGIAHPASLDVTHKSSIRQAFDVAEAELGTVDILVNNAGISRSGLLLNLAEDDWDAVLNTNLKAVWQVAREAAARMRIASCSGSIINVASILAFGTGKGLGSYMAAKAGVVQLTRAMALEWATMNIRVNALAPGYFPTEISGNFFATPMGQEMIGRIPQQRVGDINELTGPLLMLASDASSYMTGSILTVDGGHLCTSL
jgi:NAD(P)-dependent dehydrogenase (short-subunit alcohol dehydrogenase family)